MLKTKVSNAKRYVYLTLIEVGWFARTEYRPTSVTALTTCRWICPDW